MLGEPAWQQAAALKPHTQDPQFMGLVLKLTQTPPRQTWLTVRPSRLLITQRHCSAGTPVQLSPPLTSGAAPMWPNWQSAQLEHVSPASQVPFSHIGPVGQPIHSVKSPHEQSLPQVRLRVSVPLPPEQARDSVSIIPIVHSVVAPTHSNAPQLQSERHVRR